MLFNSDIFLFLFLPTVLFGFYLLGYFRQLNAALFWLVIASLFFYGWWNPAYLVLLAASIVVNFIVGSRMQKQQGSKAAKTLLMIGVLFNLGLLGYFKYANFFVDSINFTFGSSYHLDKIILPLAISFFTFQQIAYLVDVYQGKAREYNFLHYCLFVTFFPQLIAGPIVHHEEMMPQFMGKNLGRLVTSDLAIGISVFMLGLFKKMVFADNVAVYATPVFSAADAGQTITFVQGWVGALSYTLQIYFDFSGYSDMAIGLARMFGVRLPLNFNSPYKAHSIVDFWRRWHMTLSRFLRDYVYIPLGGNRLGNSRRYTNLMIVMLVGGLWHGAGWTFVVWGGLHGSYLLINHAWRGLRKGKEDGLFLRCLYPVLTMLAVIVAWVFFRAETFTGATEILYAMAGGNGIQAPEWMTQVKGFARLVRMSGLEAVPMSGVPLEAMQLIVFLFLIAFLMPNTQQIMRNYMEPAFYSIQPVSRWVQRICFEPNLFYAVALGVLSAMTITTLWQTSEFLYFQF